MKELNRKLGNIELYISSVLLFLISTLTLMAALLRTFGSPVNWALDSCLVMFAWLIFLGGDYLIRTKQMIRIDIIQRNLPKSVQKASSIIFNILILGLLVFLIVYGFQLVAATKQRLITTLHLSYTWVTCSVPVGAILMSTSVLMELIETIRTPASKWEG